MAATGAGVSRVPRTATLLRFVFATFMGSLLPVAGGTDGAPTSLVDNSILLLGICASRSTATGVQTTSATVGIVSSFTIQARDEYGQPVQTQSQSFIVFFRNEERSHSFSSVTHPQPGAVTDVTITAGGTSCTTGGTLTASQGAPHAQGSGFSATFTVSGGAIDAVAVTSAGIGYTHAPLLSIATGGAGCTGVTLTPVVTLAGEHYGSFVTTVGGKYSVSPVLLERGGLNASYFNNVWLHGDPAVLRVDESVNFDWGLGAVTPLAADRVSARWEGVVRADPASSVAQAGLRGSVRKVQAITPGTGCAADGTLAATGGGGSGFAAHFAIEGYVSSEGVYEVGIGSITITNPGAMYSSAPTLSIATGGTGCTGYRLEAHVTGMGELETVFYVETDGGVRLWVDDAQVIDAWDSPVTTSAVSTSCTNGESSSCTKRGVLSCAESGPYVSFSSEGRSRRMESNACPAAVSGGARALAQEYEAEFPVRPILSRHPVGVARRGRPVTGVVGWALDGVPFFAPLDSDGNDQVLKDQGTFDHCNGHSDSYGVYHYHSNPVCTYIDTPGKHSPLAGLMLDGMPIYGLLGDEGVFPTDLDECGGHSDATHGYYHYHLVASFPYTVACLQGCVDTSKLSGPAIRIRAQGPCIPSAFQHDYSTLRLPASSASATRSRTEGGAGGVAKLRTFTGTASLAAGGLYKVRLEYKHEAGAAVIRLSWSPGLGVRAMMQDFSLSHPVLACSLEGARCGIRGGLVVQPGVAAAAASSVTALKGLYRNVSLAVFNPFDPMNATLFEEDNYYAEAGDVAFAISAADVLGNMRTAGGDTFSVDIIRQQLVGYAEGGSTAGIFLPEAASGEDEAYNGLTLDVTEGTGAGQRVTISNYMGATREAKAAFSPAPDPSSRFSLGPLTTLSTDLTASATGGVQDIATGDYLVRSALSVAGNYTVWARLDATTHIIGSPFHVRVGNSLFNAANSTVVVPYVWTAGAAQQIWIVSRDTYGNNVSSSAAFPDACVASCGAVRFSVVVKAALRTTLVTKGAVASAGGSTYFTLASSANAFPGTYVGLAINVNGETRNITHHGSAQSDSTTQGRVVTVNTGFTSAPTPGDAYYVTKVEDSAPGVVRVCRVTQGDGSEYSAACPAIRETGEYLVEARSGGTLLADSPRRVRVHPSWKCASTSTASGAGLSLATAGAAATFTIQTRDSLSQLSTRGGDSFSIYADRSGAITPIEFFSYCAPSLTAPRASCTTSTVGIGTQTVSDQDTGAYAVSITPTRSGKYRVSILLGRASPLFASPFALQVHPGALCTTKSSASGAGISLATAGLQSRFTLNAKDAYSNPVSVLHLDTTSCASGGAAGPCLLTLTVGTESWTYAPRDSGLLVRPASEDFVGWDVAYTLKEQSGGANLTTTLTVGGAAVGNLEAGGLFATYYSDLAFSSPMTVREDSSIDFSGTGVGFSAGAESLYRAWPWRGLFEADATTSLLADSLFAARWTGRVSPAENATYTFGTGLATSSERVKLWIDSSLIISQWSSLSALRPEGTFAFVRGGAGDGASYTITVEYKQESSATVRKARLTWATGGAAAATVPSGSLLRTRAAFTTLAEAFAPAAPLFSAATGDGLSLQTVGAYSYFTITARDSLNLARDLSASQRLAFSATAGVDAGGLSATYYSTQHLTRPSLSLFVEGPIYFSTGNSTLARTLFAPSASDSADTFVVVSASTLGAAAGEDVIIGGVEVVRVVSISSNTLTVLRGRAGTSAMTHVAGTVINTLPVNSLPSATGYSVRWAGIMRPQYAETYTFTAKVQEADERVKLWVNDVLLVDAWTSLSATALTATWASPQANGYYNIQMEYKEAFGKDGWELRYKSDSEADAQIPTSRLYKSSAMLFGEVAGAGSGIYRGRALTTVSGDYTSSLIIASQGGLTATYYSDRKCRTFAAEGTDPDIDFFWDRFRPKASVPADDFCVRWSGFIAPEFSEETTFQLRADDHARLWIGGGLLIDAVPSPGGRVSYDATVSLSKDALYPIKVEYMEAGGHASVQLRWRSASAKQDTLERVNVTLAESCHLGNDNLQGCVSSSGWGASGGKNYLSGVIKVTDGSSDATGTFSVDSAGTITDVTLSTSGGGFITDPDPASVSIYYNDSLTDQSATVSSVDVESGGTGYVNGLVFITGGSSPATGVLYVVAGVVQSVRLFDRGAGFDSQVPASAVELLHGSLNTTQTSSITFVTITGSATTVYADGDATVTCTGSCTGSGFAGTCNTRSAVISISITSPGFGYTSANPPSISCPSGVGHTFTPVIASGAVLSARVATGARLFPIRKGHALTVVPSSRLFAAPQAVKGWEGTDGQSLTVHPLALCGSTSSVSSSGAGWEVSLATVGYQSAFTITARDQYGNRAINTTEWNSTSFFLSRLTWVTSATTGIEVFKWYDGAVASGVTSVGEGLYTLTYAASEHTTAGTRALRTGLAVQGGLSATYYLGADYSWGAIDPFYEPASKFPAANIQPVETVDFSGTPGTWPAAPGCLVGPYPFAARWNGFFKQTSGGDLTYTFEAPLKGAKDRVRLWVSNNLVIDQWSSLTTLSPVATAGLILSSETPYTLELQYKTDSSTRGVTLNHEVSGASSIVSSESLFHAYHVRGGHEDAVVMSRGVCGGTSLLSGNSLSLATASTYATFTITARDVYSNVHASSYAPASADEPFIVRVAIAGSVASAANVSDLSDGTYAVTYRVTEQGTHTLTVSTPLTGGLSATYFSDMALSSAVYLRTDSFSSLLLGTGDTSSETQWPGRAGEAMSGGAFSVRWEGFVKPTLPGAYRVRTRLGDVDDRVRLWLDNSLLVDQWSSRLDVVPTGTYNLASAGAYYDFKVEYKEVAGTQGAALEWQLEPESVVIVDETGCVFGCTGITATASTRGVWLTDTAPGTSYLSSYYQDGNVKKGSLQVVFTFPEAFGVYEVSIMYPSDVSFATNTPVTIIHASGTSKFSVDQTSGGGVFTSMGSFAFGSAGATLIIANAGTSSTVTADAVRFTRAAPNHDRVLDSGLVTGAPLARTLLLASSASSAANAYVNNYLTIGTERRRVQAYPGGSKCLITVDHAFSMGDTTLTSAAAVSDTTIAVTDAASAGIIAGRVLEIDDELLLVTSVATNTVTVARGHQNTIASAHTSLSTVFTVLIASGVIDTGSVSSVTSSSVFVLADSAPARAGALVGYTLTIGFATSLETRTITAYTVGRQVTVDPAFSDTLIAATSTYSVGVHALYYISDVPLKDASGDECAPCVIPSAAFAAAPRVQESVVVSASLGRSVSASGVGLTSATAGIAASFTVTLTDAVGNTIPADATVIFANGTQITSTYGYGSQSVAAGVVVAASDAYTFTLSEAALALANRYVGYSISIAGETRTVVEYTSGRVVTVNVPFTTAPTTTSKFTLSAVAAGHPWFESPGWFAGSACDMSTATGTPLTCDITYSTTTAGIYAVSVNVFRLGGLQANYFHNTFLQETPAVTRVDSTIDFDWGDGLVTPSARDHVGVRWTGLVVPSYTETYTFTTNTTGFGPVLRVHDTLLVSEWNTDIGCVKYDPNGGCLRRTESFGWTRDFPDSGVQGVFSGTIALTAGTFYEVRMDYRHKTGSASAQLWWSSVSQNMTIVPSSALYYPFEAASGSPFVLRVASSDTLCGASTVHTTDEELRCTACGSIGTAYGHGLSLATAGVATTFNLISKDQYGNVRDAASSLILARVDADPSCGLIGTGRALSGNCTARKAVTPSVVSSGGVFRWTYTTNTKAPTALTVGAMEVGGLFATYYSQADCTGVYNTRAKEGTGVASVSIVSIGGSCSADGSISATTGAGLSGSGFSGSFVQRGGSVGKVYVTNAGVGYDSAPTLSCCQQIISVSVSGTGTGYTSSGAATADCTSIASCTGSGFAGTCTSDGATVSAVVITSHGSGYAAAYPPLVTCAGGTGQTFTPTIDTSIGGTNCAGVAFTANMQFTSSGETWIDAETAPVNEWWGGDAASAGARLATCGLFAPYRVRLDPTIDFASVASTGAALASTWPGEGALSLADGKWFSARWTGFIKPAAAGEHTFHTTLADSDERVKVWIDNSLLIDQWSSLSALTAAATYGSLSTSAYYSLTAAYKQEEGDRQAKLEWEAPGVSKTVIPSGNMYRIYQAENDTHAVTVHAAVPCGTTSSASGVGLTLTTAGVLASFTLTARDAFANLRDTLHDEAYGYMYKTNVRVGSLATLRPTNLDRADGLQVMSFNITRAGSATVNAWVAQSGGLHATYFDDEALTSALYIREDVTVDFSGTGDVSSTSQWPGASAQAVTGGTFAVKWVGFVRPPHDYVYTFSMEVQDTTAAPSDDRVRVWVDNQLILDQWDSLDSLHPVGTFSFPTREVLYDIEIDIKCGTGPQRAILRWQSDGSNATAACDFSSPAPFPPRYEANLCGWRQESSCDDGNSLCVRTSTTFGAGFTATASKLGASVALVGDLDGDGVPDAVAGAPGDTAGGGADTGAIYIMLLTTTGTLNTAGPTPSGVVKLYMGASSWATCATCMAVGDAFGTAVAGLGDLDGNGVPDIVVSSMGVVFVLYMTRNIDTVCIVCPVEVLSHDIIDVSSLITSSGVPSSLGALGDWDLLGTRDVAMGYESDATGGANYGAVFILHLTRSSAGVISLASSVTIADGTGGFTQDCTGGACRFGSSVALIGDVNGDAVPDLAVGARSDDCGGTDRGAVYILFMNADDWTVTTSVKICASSAGLDPSWIASDSAEFGASVARAGDINGDGIPDLLVGSPQDSGGAGTYKGAIYWISLTRAGTVLDVDVWGGASDYQVAQTAGAGMGAGLAVLGDLDHDGLADLLTGNALDASADGSVTTFISGGFAKWVAGGTPLGSTPSDSTGPNGNSTAQGMFFPYSYGKYCNDGVLFPDAVGSSGIGDYSFLFAGTDADCATRCAEDATCNYYTAGLSDTCWTYRSCEKESASTDATAITFRKGSYLYLEGDAIGTTAAPGSAEFISPPGHYKSISLFYHMYGAGTGKLSVSFRSVASPVVSGTVAAVVSTTEFTLDGNALSQLGVYVGRILQIGSEWRTITGYTTAKVATVDDAFSATPSITSLYTIHDKVSECIGPCFFYLEWFELWSVTGEQHAAGDTPWTQIALSLQGYPRPLEVRIEATLGSSTLSDIAVDRISLLSFNSPWSTDTGRTRTTAVQVVPSNRLYKGYHVTGSPFSLVVRPNITDPAMSTCDGCGTTASASAATSVNLTLKDAFGNERTEVTATEAGGSIARPTHGYAEYHEDGVAVVFASETDSSERIDVNLSTSAGAVYTGDFTPAGLDETGTTRVFASSVLSVRMAKAGGLNATYHRGVDLAFPVKERVDATVDFSCTQAVPGTGLPADYFSVRWRGLVRPPYSETFTFKTVTSSSNGQTGVEGVRVWLSGQKVDELELLIDQWSGKATEYTGTVVLLRDTLYDIQIEYKDSFSSSKMQLHWKSDSLGASYAVIPSNRLYYDVTYQQDPVDVTVSA